MPEVRRGSKVRTASDSTIPNSPASYRTPLASPPAAEATSIPSALDANATSPSAAKPETRTTGILDGAVLASPASASRPELAHRETPRKSLAYDRREAAPVYLDSRAATQHEFRRRAKDLQEYYDDNPHLLPQLPFTWHHGSKRWRLFMLIFFMFVDACAVPIGLYYGMHYAGDVQGWIIFAVVTTIWGGPAYLEFAIRTLRLIKKERFYRPLGTDSRWSFDFTTWICVITITVVTALFIIGSAPHIVWTAQDIYIVNNFGMYE